MNYPVLSQVTPAAPGFSQESFLAMPIQLGSDLWFDAATATILRQGQEIPLTAREASLLMLLLTMPGRFHTTSNLARLLRKRQTSPTAHSIEQTIFGLRKKLGEHGQASQVLRSRRGLGYGLFLLPGIQSHPAR